ncbi:MAG: hypothetical protein Kow0098_26610 [Ignavibacteriaceae bacterium]
MFKKIYQRFKGDRKYFTIVFFIFLLILLTGIITPVLIDNLRSDWNRKLSELITSFEKQILKIYKEKEADLLRTKKSVKSELQSALSPGNSSYRNLIEAVNKKEYNNYSVEVLAPNGKLIAWNNSIAVPQEKIFPLEFPLGETHFHNSDLITYLSIVDSVTIQNDVFYFLVSLPFEKHYQLQNDYFDLLSFSKSVSDLLVTGFEMIYSPFESASKDGRKHSFEILNNRNHKIAMAFFFKPSLNNSISEIKDTSNVIQSVLVLLAFVFLLPGFRSDFNSMNSAMLKFFIISIYVALLRILMFSVNFPSSVISGEINDPAYFSSVFGWGVVKSPLEFFITCILLIIIAVTAFRYFIEYYSKPLNKKFLFIKYLSLIPVIGGFFLLLRGLSASVKSVVFDSTLRYFKEPTLIPNFPYLMMNLNVLMLGLSAVLILTIIVLFTYRLISFTKKKAGLRFLLIYVVFIVSGYIFFQSIKEPLITPVLIIIFISTVFIFSAFVIFINPLTLTNYVYGSIAASIITITLLNYFNLELEKLSLRTTSFEINRANDNLLTFMLDETLRSAYSNRLVTESFSKNDINYDAVSFIIWANSSLQKESLNSSVILFDRYRKKAGQFGININNEFNPLNYFRKFEESEPTIKKVEYPEGSGNYLFTGIIPVYKRGNLMGFISASLGFDLQNLGTAEIPGFLASRKNLLNTVIDVNQLKIFEFHNSKITTVFGDIYPSREQTEPILNAKLNEYNEAFITVDMNGEKYITFVQKIIKEEHEKVTAVLVPEKKLTWNLYNFFKIFIVHSLFIFAFSILLVLKNYRNISYSFRSQLLLAFLLISVIPVAILAVYNRQVVSERSQSAIFNELSERSEYLENHIRVQKEKYADRDFNKVFENASRELAISFSVFRNTDLFYSSKAVYSSIGLLPSKLNPIAHYNLNYLSYREFLANEKIDNFSYSSLYKKVNFSGEDFILSVNDAFNPVNVSFSTLDIDIFLFGVYSFALIVIIVVSTFLANKISSPIRRLTKATESVARGDLSVELTSNQKGEIGDLLSGFNLMTRELQKNQLELAALERENAWKEMAKQVAHEIKNPLTPMKLAVQQLIASYKDNSESFKKIFDKVTSTILTQIENLSLIASEFSRFAKMPSLKIEKINLNDILGESVNLFVEEKTEIILNSPQEHIIIEADKTQLLRTMINLIRNSIQAGATIVRISVTVQEFNVIIRIDDNGSGIPEGIRDRIFESNFTTKDKGMGIGLKLSKRFLESIGGQIKLIDSELKGTCFQIILKNQPEENKEKIT